MRIGTFLEKQNFFSYLTPNFLLFLVSIKSARSRLRISNFLFLKTKKKVRVELWNFVETIFREGTKEKVVLTINKNRSNERKTLRAHYSEMVGRRLKRFFASFCLRSNLNFKKKNLFCTPTQSSNNRLFPTKQLINSWLTAVFKKNKKFSRN